MSFDTSMTLDTLNTLPDNEARDVFTRCCASTRWVDAMVARRPFTNGDALLGALDQTWCEMNEADFLEAFLAHPKIGDVNSLRKKYANTQAMASGEQSGVNGANEAVIKRLAEGNQAYEEKFGFIFIVCATGKSAAQMLALLDARLPNNRAQEIANGAEEQRKITRLRLMKLLDGGEN